MEPFVEPPSCDRHRRKLCGHCNEMLSYSAYRSHKDLYYDETKQKWNTRLGSTDDVDSNVDDETQNVLEDRLLSEDEEQNEILGSNMMDTSDFDFPEDDSIQNSVLNVVEECTIYSDPSTSSEHEGSYTYDLCILCAHSYVCITCMLASYTFVSI